MLIYLGKGGAWGLLLVLSLRWRAARHHGKNAWIVCLVMPQPYAQLLRSLNCLSVP